METRKKTRKVLHIVLALIVVVAIIGMAFWLIKGRSPKAEIIAHALPQTTMEDYERGKSETTDKSTVEIPEDVKFPREVTEYRVGHMQVFESPAEDDTKPILLYIHGGAYVNNFAPLHWKTMAEWAKATGCGIVTPNYPLLFRYTAKEAHQLMLQLYQQLLQRYPASRIIVAGDSAGGGFTLALAQQLKADSIDLPSHLVLISPWVDVTGGDDALQEYDTFLNNEVLRHIGADWAADLDPRDPIISPLYGDMQGLPPTDLFTGTWEVFFTDIVVAYNKMRAAGVDARIHVKEKMGHVYPLWPCPEGKAARKEIAEIILNTK